MYHVVTHLPGVCGSEVRGLPSASGNTCRRVRDPDCGAEGPQVPGDEERRSFGRVVQKGR